MCTRGCPRASPAASVAHSVMQRAFTPTVLVQVTLTDGTIRTFEMTVEQLQELRFKYAPRPATHPTRRWILGPPGRFYGEPLPASAFMRRATTGDTWGAGSPEAVVQSTTRMESVTAVREFGGGVNPRILFIKPNAAPCWTRHPPETYRTTIRKMWQIRENGMNPEKVLGKT